MPVTRVVFVVSTSLEIWWKRRPSGHGQAVDGFWSLPHQSGCRSIAGAAGEGVKELLPPEGD